MSKATRIMLLPIFVVLWVPTFLLIANRDTPLGLALIPGITGGAAIAGITWRLAKNVSRAFRRLSVAIGLLGFIVAFLFGAPVFVDTFDLKNSPTLLDIVVPNLVVSLPYAVLPASTVLLIGWVVAKVRNQDQNTPP